MKKLVSLLLVGLVAMALTASADSYTYTYVNAGIGTNWSAAIPVSGWLDKIEIYNVSGATRTGIVTVCTAYSNTTIEIYANNISNNTAKVIRPRVKGTDQYGTALTYELVASSDATNEVQQVQVLYEKPMIGGNLKIQCKNHDATVYCTNVVVIYYEPLKR